MTNKQNADASESFRQLMAAYSKAFSSTPDSVKEEENADDTATTTENGTTPSPRTASILDADDETTETALEFNLERAKLLNRQKEQELEEQAQKIKRLKARNARRWLSIILRGILAVTAIVFVGIQLWNCNAIVSEYVAYMIHTDKPPRSGGKSASVPRWWDRHAPSRRKVRYRRVDDEGATFQKFQGSFQCRVKNSLYPGVRIRAFCLIP